MVPSSLFRLWFLALLSIGIIAGAAGAVYEWQKRSWGWDPSLQRSVFSPELGANTATAVLVLALVLLVAVLFGRLLLKLLCAITLQKPASGPSDSPRGIEPTSTHWLHTDDGAELKVETFGPEDGLPVVLTHGWGLAGAEWNYLKREIGDKFRLIVWDEPGLGASTPPKNQDYSLESLARKLAQVAALEGNRPLILAGHSIGGMITLTFCRLFPERLGSHVAGLLLAHTTPTNPVRTTGGAAILTALRRPFLSRSCTSPSASRRCCTP